MYTEKQKLYAAIYYKNNKHKIHVNGKIWKQKNRKKYLKKRREWWIINKDRLNLLRQSKYIHRKLIKKISIYKNPVEKRLHFKLKFKYGISILEYQKMVENQSCLCSICKNPPKNGRLYVDHNHKTGKIRELLCQSCNTGLGSFKDNMMLLSNAMYYLKRFI